MAPILLHGTIPVLQELIEVSGSFQVQLHRGFYMLATKYLIVLWPVCTAGSDGDRWPKLLLCHCPLFFFLILPPKPSNFSLNFDLNQDCMQLCHLYHINPSIPFSHFCPPQVFKALVSKWGPFKHQQWPGQSEAWRIFYFSWLKAMTSTISLRLPLPFLSAPYTSEVKTEHLHCPFWS